MINATARTGNLSAYESHAKKAIAALHDYDQGTYRRLIKAEEEGDKKAFYMAIASLALTAKCESEVNADMLRGYHRLRDYFLTLAKDKRFKGIKRELKDIASKIDPDRVEQLSLF
ncbi:hypothetical protein [Roseofilum capinflatum]|uniref:Uncharacterized protein n=1 Tax=Roseofilum capinflatum BLCC-M114 TaxID=3022440 RepID=A0ABT7B9D1_9CYAN|nr:hypothetical protein [Roseofilum capinflatum]MDJ1174878.1 hypothetical protein [Roseofilum capinflatum BLCC-M114]